MQFVDVNFRLEDAESGHWLAHGKIPMPNEGDIVSINNEQYRINVLETHRVKLCHLIVDGGGLTDVVLLTTATVEPI